MKEQLKRFFPVLLILILGCKPAASPTADLASPSQEERDAAAIILRATAKPPSKIKWILRTAFIRKGENETNILKLLRSYHLSTQSEGGLGGLVNYREYRLDDYWLLSCAFNGSDNSLISWKLTSGWRDVYVNPPTNFTGTWITYYVNGQKSWEAVFTNGSRSGEFIAFSPSGSTNSVWHYDHDKANGLWTQYFPSGRIEVQCLYSNSLRVGDMVWHYENGSKKDFEHYDNGKPNGLRTIYFPSGKIEYQCQYSNGVKVGLEVVYNEDGTTNSVRDLSNPQFLP